MCNDITKGSKEIKIRQIFGSLKALNENSPRAFK